MLFVKEIFCLFHEYWCFVTFITGLCSSFRHPIFFVTQNFTGILFEVHPPYIHNQSCIHLLCSCIYYPRSTQDLFYNGIFTRFIPPLHRLPPKGNILFFFWPNFKTYFSFLFTFTSLNNVSWVTQLQKLFSAWCGALLK